MLYGSFGTSTKGCVLFGKTPRSDIGNVIEDASPVLKSSLLDLVFSRNPSLKSWMFLKYKNFVGYPHLNLLLEIMSSLGGIFESFGKHINIEASQVDSNEDDSDSSKFVSQPHSISRRSNQHETLSDQSGRAKSSNESGVENLSGTLSRHQMLSPATRAPLDFKSNSFEGRKHVKNVDKNQVSDSSGASALRSSSRGVSITLASPGNYLAASYGSTSSQTAWYFDGDPAAMLNLCVFQNGAKERSLNTNSRMVRIIVIRLQVQLLLQMPMKLHWLPKLRKN
ncbi:uncharacterized protein LOC111314889 [Durio zibethinus]|uniref:Uncharacterized protein LOC111314889 n=1 Tax=Durio zibethinus TaxID=66656 RepID=A0A6P6B514_DURZI|nr:uncharacterized protein LOC111314889 [Durio zibethinus]XP_022772238.1 uncharacterized protein LOC111314889 [Durio zibethinus]